VPDEPEITRTSPSGMREGYDKCLGFSDHGRPAFRGYGLEILLDHPEGQSNGGCLSHHPPMGIGIEAVVPNHDLALDAYIRRLIEAGYGKRIMFGSDNMAWPESIRLAVESIESADFLTPEQKRDIFYNNAARFFRLE
jgi:hypothetical protein